MSDIFHKSCYTSRSSGYKYRTLATNTGERKRRDSTEDTAFERKFKELNRRVMTRIDKQLNRSQTTRDMIQNRLEKLNTKIDSMLELQNNVASLRKDLVVVENTLTDLTERVSRLDQATTPSDRSSIGFGGLTFRTPTVATHTMWLLYDLYEFIQKNVYVFKTIKN